MNAKKILDTVHNAAKEARYLIPQPARGVLDTLPNAGNNITSDLHVLIRSLSVNTITNGLMKRAVENDILSEIELSDLLRTKCHIDTEYEKYAAELSGLSLDEPVDIYIKDFLELCEPRFREILGIREEILGKEGGK